MTLETQKNLARLIRAGIDSATAAEGSHAWGVQLVSLVLVANAVGLALIGKVGRDRALNLFERANAEMLGNIPATEEIFRELDITGDEFLILTKAGWNMEAMEIADILDAGLYDELIPAAPNAVTITSPR